MPVLSRRPALARRPQELLEQLAKLGGLRPSSVIERYKTCGRATCKCAQRRARGHSFNGSSRSR